MDKTIALPWHVVEQKFLEEIRWLKLAIPRFNSSTIYDRMDSESNITGRDCDCDYRRISLLMVTGVIHVREINFKGNDDLWGGLSKNTDMVIKKHKHGQEWHRGMMNILDQYFTNDGYGVVTEPNLNWGRADLGLFRNNESPIYIEVGTTSIQKLRINLQSMLGVTFLLVLEENRIIEIRT